MTKKASSFLLFIFLLLILFVPKVKAYILQGIMITGLYNTEFNTEETHLKLDAADWNLKIKNANGDLYTLSDFKEKVIVINFWATWCAPCLAELPNLNDLYATFKNEKNFILLTIETDANKKKAQEILSNKKLNLPLYFLNYKYQTNLFNGILPTTVVIDKDGTLVLKKEGIANYNNDTFKAQLHELLK